MKSLLPTTLYEASAGAALVTTDGRLVPLVGAKLLGEARGGIARLVLEQEFANRYAETLNVTYRMPLPADGAVSGYEFVIGERVIKGVVDKKRRARERFEEAIASGKTAALLEQERADIFTQRIGNIPTGETIVARITIDQRLVWLPEGEWELRFPTVIGPRYVGAADSAEDARDTHIKVAEKPLSARISCAIDIKDTIAGTASQPNGALRLDRDIVVRWPVAQPMPGITVATTKTAQGAFGLVTIVPPSPKVKPTPVPRDLIVLLDTSGSMGGAPLDKAKQVVAMMIDSLREQDRFELIEFNNAPTRYNDEPLVATDKAKQQAIKWIRSRQADGGTEMRAGVIEAMQTLRVGAQRQIVIVTDGYVGGERQILEAINRRLPRSARLHVLGVGSAVNRSLATALSRAGRGVEVLVGPDDDAERAAKRLLDRTSTPLLTNVEISGSAVLRHAPDRIPDVFERAPLVAAVMLRPDGGQIIVRGQLGTEPWEQTLEVAPVGEGNGAIAALYGRERVADVEANALFSSVDGEVEELGLMFQIATRMTSWLAIDESRRVTGPTRDELVPQELPYGTRASSFGLRGSAAMETEEEASFDMPTGGMAPAAPPPPAALSRAAPMSIGRAGDDDEAFDRVMRSTRGPRAPGAPGGGAPAEKKREIAAPAPSPQQSMPRDPQPETKIAAPEPKTAAPEPEHARGTAAAPADVRRAEPLVQTKPAPAKAKSRWPLVAAIVAALIALLLWWLLA